MKIHNKGSSEGKAWSFFGKALLCSTALIFVSCGFNTQKKENNNIGDFVDFVNLGISVEEKAPTSFGLAGGFNLVAGSLLCDKISYRWGDSASGYNPTIANGAPQAIAEVKIIDQDRFTFKLTALHCKEGAVGDYLIFDVVDNAEFSGKQYIDGEVREYASPGRNNLEVTQTGDCTGGCGAGKTNSLSFAMTNFNLETGTEAQGAASFQETLSISFSDGEPIPAFKLEHIELLNSTYDHSTGEVDIGQVWECEQEDVGNNTGDNAECSGQLIKNLSIVILDNKSIADNNGVAQDAFPAANDPGNGTAEQEATKALARQAELKAAIQYRDELQAANSNLKEVTLLDPLSANHLIAGTENAVPSIGTTPAFSDSGADSALIKHGVKAVSKAEPGFYQTLDKYACIYSVGVYEVGDPEVGNGVQQGDKNWDKLGAKCKKVKFNPIVQP